MNSKYQEVKEVNKKNFSNCFKDYIYNQNKYINKYNIFLQIQEILKNYNIEL